MTLLGWVLAVTGAPQEEQVVDPMFITAPQRGQLDGIAFYPPWNSLLDCATETTAAQPRHPAALREAYIRW
jgi:hypothetical protein